jgi:hypothetical protein
MEEWRVVEETGGFLSVSNYGRVKGARKILKPQIDHKGYERLRFTVQRERMSARVHRLVAQTFIPNPFNKPQVNHIDGNKCNNNVSNLEWVTNKENAHHAIKAGMFKNVFEQSRIANEKQKKAIVAIGDGGLNVLHFDSVCSAQKHFNSKHISAVLKGKREHTKGYRFFYAEGGDAPCQP